MATAAIDEARLEEFMGRAVTDMSAAMSAPLMVIGDKLGLYRAMAGAGPLSSADIAAKAESDERMVREWLANQVAGGYVEYDADSDRYELPPEHAMALADSAPIEAGSASIEVRLMVRFAQFPDDRASE